MASTDYRPDPYQGWRVIDGGAGNVTAHQIMTDTSWSWTMTRNFGSVRVYEQR